MLNNEHPTSLLTLSFTTLLQNLLFHALFKWKLASEPVIRSRFWVWHFQRYPWIPSRTEFITSVHLTRCYYRLPSNYLSPCYCTVSWIKRILWQYLLCFKLMPIFFNLFTSFLFFGKMLNNSREQIRSTCILGQNIDISNIWPWSKKVTYNFQKLIFRLY